MTDDKWYPAAPPEKNVWGRFEWFDQLDVAASQARDEKTTKKIITIRIKAANSDGDSVLPVRPFNQTEMVARFPEAWRAFNGEQIDPGGTKLEEMHLTEPEHLQLRMYGIHNVDMLAALSDQACGALGFGWRKKRDEAIGLIAAKKDKHLSTMLAKVESMGAPEISPENRPEIAGVSGNGGNPPEKAPENRPDNGPEMIAPKKRGRPKKIDATVQTAA